MSGLARAAALLVAAVFLYAGIVKALDPASFAVEVHNYRLLPWPAAVAVALYLPWLEILCAAALLTRRFTPPAVALLLAMMTAFILALLSAKLRGLDIACGCFGRAAKPGSFVLPLARDFALVAALLFIARHGPRSPNRARAAD